MIQKSIWEAEVVIWVKKQSVRVQEARGVRDRLTLSALCRLLCVRVCVFASALHLNTFPPFAFFPSSPLSTAVSFPCPVLFHCLYESLTCCWFLSLSDSTRQLFLLCLLTHYLNDFFFFSQLGPCVCDCVAGVCVIGAHVWDRLETGNNGSAL